MTRKRVMKAHKPSDRPDQDRATLADQWVDRNWYLPPGGDQSWREREARRRFGDGEKPVNDREYPPSADEMGSRYRFGFKHARALNIILPISLAVCVMLFVPILMPEILTSGFWSPYEPKALTVTPVRLMKEAAVEENAALRPAYGDGSDRDGNKAANRMLSQQTGQAVAPIKIYRNTVLPNPRSAIVTKDAKDSAHASRVAKSLQRPSSRQRALKSLPPIGAEYFASHAPAGKQVADSTRPIGQAYFERHSPAATD